MPTALLIADLEGVAGVDQLEALAAGSTRYSIACERLTAEVNAAVCGLLRAGFTQVVVSDSHRSGGSHPNVLAQKLHPQAELVWEEDPYAEHLFAHVGAVICLGMHAAAGTAGFASHTLYPHCGVFAGKRALSETDLVLALARQHRVPVVFVSGDDVLARSLQGVRYVRTKRALSPSAAVSKEPTVVLAALARAAEQPPQEAPAAPKGALSLRFKSVWQAARAERAGGHRVDEVTVRVAGESFVGRYRNALRVLEDSAEPPPSDGRRGLADVGVSGAEEAALLLRSFVRRAPASYEARAARALKAFLRHTDGGEAWQRADRALTLHMLEAHAPVFFRRHRLRPVLARAVAALTLFPSDFPMALEADEAMARLDGLYVRSERGEACAIDSESFAACLSSLMERGEVLHAWLLAEIAAQLGVEARPALPPRYFRHGDRLRDLYWLTHLFLLKTRYLRCPLPPHALGAEIEELFLATGWVVEQGLADLAAELAFCLQSAGEHRSREHRSLLGFLSRRQSADGTIADEGDDVRGMSHSTAAALLAFAGAKPND